MRIIFLLFVIAALIAMLPNAMRQYFITVEQDNAVKMLKEQNDQAKRTIEQLRREGKLDAPEPDDATAKN